MTTGQTIGLVLLLSCLFIFGIAPILYTVQAYQRSKRGEESEMPQSYRMVADSASLGVNAFKRLQDPFAEETADLAELAELAEKIREEDQETD